MSSALGWLGASGSIKAPRDYRRSQCKAFRIAGTEARFRSGNISGLSDVCQLVFVEPKTAKTPRSGKKGSFGRVVGIPKIGISSLVSSECDNSPAILRVFQCSGTQKRNSTTKRFSRFL